MKKNTAKRALLMSVLSLLLCVSMLVGTTFAWFTDSVTSAGNIIKSGNLDVEMYWAEGAQAVPTEDSGWTDASQGAIFDYDLWEPGYTQVRHIKIANEGTLALKYQLNIVPNGEVSILADVIDVYFADPAATTDRAMTGMTRIGTLREVLAGMPQNACGTLLADTSATVTIALKMQESAGNEYQNKAIGTDFSVVLVATQYTYEKDSFDETYDDLNFTPDYSALSDMNGQSGNYLLTDDIVVSDKIYFGDNTENTIDLNGKDVTTTSSYVFATQGANCVLTINGNGNVATNTGYVAFANKNSTLIVNGGTYELGNIDQAAHLYTQNSATTVINGGTFISTDANTPIVYCINSFVEINGGFFQNTANPNQALLSMGNNLKYVNNQKITLKGGTFVNWNPMDSAFARPWTNPDVPALIVLADGYEMISETQTNGDVWYTVVPVASGN